MPNELKPMQTRLKGRIKKHMEEHRCFPLGEQCSFSMLMGQAIVVSEVQLVDPPLADMTITDIINQLRTLQDE